MYIFVGYILMSTRAINARIYLFVIKKSSTIVTSVVMASNHSYKCVLVTIVTSYTHIINSQDDAMETVRVVHSSDTKLIALVRIRFNYHRHPCPYPI